jgi:hypothetical protein
LQKQIGDYDQQNADESCQVEQVEVHGYRHRDCEAVLNLAFLQLITTSVIGSSTLLLNTCLPP